MNEIAVPSNAESEPLLCDTARACELLGNIHRSTLHRGIKAGIYPRPAAMGPNGQVKRFVVAEILEAVRQRIAERDGNASA